MLLVIILFIRSYQESGRAGRDGEQADCILFYSYKDKKVLENMIRKSAKDSYSDSTRRKVDQLHTCVRYCEDEFRCRRTMQLEFFGETFNRRLCSKTCDNCKAGREPERKDMTNEARTILNLFNDVARLRTFGGVTMFQLSELYKGSKSKSALKGLEKYDLKRVMKGYGTGSALKKHEIDRIMHAMIFDHLLLESGVDTKGGFAVDYVNLGENANAMLQGGRKLIVEVPRAQQRKAPAETSKKDSAKITKEKSPKKKKSTSNPKKTPPPARASKEASANSNTSMDIDGGLKFTEGAGSDDSDDDSWDGGESLRTGRSSSAPSKSESPSALPSNHVTALAKEIKLLTSMWADEEQMYGNQVFCKSFVSLRFRSVVPAICFCALTYIFS